MKSNKIRYPGEDVTVTYDIKRCIHASECAKGLPEVFNPRKKPWVDPDQASADEVAEVIERCPTGALKYARHDGGREEVSPDLNTITVAENGPLYLRGDITIRAVDGSVLLEDTRVALCRCGASKNKPICDMAHDDVEFADAGHIVDSTLKEAEGNGQATGLTVTLAQNGPLLIEGPVAVSSANDQVRVEGVKGALCRCGGSGNKPFCDGTHKSIGFEG